MLKLMDSSNNSSDGVASLYLELIQQSGLTTKAFAQRLQIIEGDLGTCLNFAGLYNQRTPSSHADESLQHLLMIPGAGHTMWNICHQIFLYHWGDPSSWNDLGAWQSVVALGGEKDRPTLKKDFTEMLWSVERVHEARICHCVL